MAVPYIDLFNLVYSTSISESLKSEILESTNLPLFESEITIDKNIYESIYFLDELAYSNMSEGLINSIIDDVFEGCSEEYLEEVYEAYVRAKALMYISEDSESWNVNTYRKDIKTPRAIQDVIDKAEARKKGNFISKAKEGIKNAVGKVKNWWSGRKQKAPSSSPEVPSSGKYKSLSQVMQGKTPKTPDRYKEYQDIKDAEQLMKSYDDSMKRHKIPKVSTPAQVSPKEPVKVTANGSEPKSVDGNANTDQSQTKKQKQIEYLKKFVSKDTGDKGSSNPMASLKSIARHHRKLNRGNKPNEEAKEQENNNNNTSSPGQLSMLTSKGNISKKYLSSIKSDGDNKTSHEVADKIVNNGGKKKEEGKEAVVKKS